MKIGSLGGGQMANAILQGVIRSGLCEAKDVSVFDINAAQVAQLATLGAHAAASAADVVRRSDLLLLCVKPHVLPMVLAEISPHVVPGRHLVVSIAAGVSLASLEAQLPAGCRVVRVMPNTPSLVQQAVAGMAGGRCATEADMEAVTRVFGTLGITGVVPESLLDAVTGISGSGPAYVYMFIEALADGGVRAGLPRDLALRFAAQTVKGAAEMVLETKQHPAVLKDAVASPGGTTIAAVHALEQGGFRGVVMDAVQAAVHRAAELGKPSKL